MKYLFLSFFRVVGFCAYAQVAGCTDSLVNNYSFEAIINGGTCT